MIEQLRTYASNGEIVRVVNALIEERNKAEEERLEREEHAADLTEALGDEDFICTCDGPQEACSSCPPRYFADEDCPIDRGEKIDCCDDCCEC